MHADQQLYPGGVILVPLQNSEMNSEFYYNENLVTIVRENNKSYLLFGIPYNSSAGTNSFVFNAQAYKKIITLNIEQNKFGTQNIKINKYKKNLKNY